MAKLPLIKAKDLIKFLEELGVIDVGWMSDEDLNPFDAVPLRTVTLGNLREVLEEVGQELLAKLI